MNSKSPSKNCLHQSSQQKVKIIIRMRPILQQQNSDQFVQLEDDNTLQIRRPGNFIRMKFNNILPPDSTQKDVFCLVEDSIKQFLKGTNVTIFAYGQTGTGKTYSIMGNFSPNEEYQNIFDFLSSKQRGVLSRSLQMIMRLIAQKKQSKIQVSFFQIYNEKIYDLYNFTLKPLDIRQGKNGEVLLPGLSKIEVSTINEVITFLIAGFKNRATGQTIKNARSSRSHSIFQIQLVTQSQSKQSFHSTLRIVDLAGSQKFKIPADMPADQKQIHTQQLISINSSLSCLGFCITALTQKSRSHIPFRNSKLTRILTDSLLGNGIMRFIVCISPSLSASNQTFSTLQFANRAKKAIFSHADSNMNQRSASRQSQNDEIARLRLQLNKQRQMRANLQHELESIMDQFPQYINKVKSRQDSGIYIRNKSKCGEQFIGQQSFQKHSFDKFFIEKKKNQHLIKPSTRRNNVITPTRQLRCQNSKKNSLSSSKFHKDTEGINVTPSGKPIKYLVFSQAASPNVKRSIKNTEKKQDNYDTATILSNNKNSQNKKKISIKLQKQNQDISKINKKSKISSFFIDSPQTFDKNIKSQYNIQQQDNLTLKQLKLQLNKKLYERSPYIDSQSPTFKQQQISNFEIITVLPSQSRTNQKLVEVYSPDSSSSHPNIKKYRQELIFLRQKDKNNGKQKSNPISYSKSSVSCSIDSSYENSFNNSIFNHLNRQEGNMQNKNSRRDRIINLFR